VKPAARSARRTHWPRWFLLWLVFDAALVIGLPWWLAHELMAELETNAAANLPTDGDSPSIPIFGLFLALFVLSLLANAIMIFTIRRRPRRHHTVSAVSLAPFEPGGGLPVVAAWLRQAHVARWWGDPAEAVAAIAGHPVATEAFIEVDSAPVGFVCWQTPSPEELAAAGLGDLPHDIIDVDIMIGDPGLLGRGVGPAALAQLLSRLRVDGVRLVGLAAAVANTRALRAYEKAGFRPYRDFQEAGEDCRYLVQRLDAAT